MKKVLFVLLLLSILLLSSCELGTGGKAITTGQPQWTPLYICFEYQAGDQNMWDFFYSPDSNCLGKVLWKSNSGVPGTMGYVSKTPFTGSVLLSECMRKHTEIIRNVFRQRTGQKDYYDRYVIQGKSCPEGDFSHEIGYVYASQTPGTSPLYRCWMDRFNEGIWDHYLSFDSTCPSSRIGKVNQEGIYGWVPTKIPIGPVVEKPAVSECDNLKATNTDLNNKINEAINDIESLKAQLNTIK